MEAINTCRLCYTNSSLKESHIIPKFMLRFIRDKTMDNRFYELGINTNKIVQDGPKEYLLCNECEQKIGRFEKYFKENIYLKHHRATMVQDNRCFMFNNLDYRSIKLFLLSVLWRMSISSLDQFDSVSLEEDEDKIRNMIYEENSGKRNDYPIVGIIPLINGRFQESWMCFPLVDKIKNIHCIIIDGILYIISLTQYDLNLSECMLNESGNWKMPALDIYQIPFLMDLIESTFNNHHRF